jgi:sugar phosphate isomerase/epimerase
MLEEALSVSKRAGYLRVQLIEEFLAPALIERSVSRASKLGLEISIACASGPMHTRETAESTRAATLAQAKRLLGNAEWVGFTISPRSDGKPKTSEELRMQAWQVSLLGQELAHTGMRLLLEHEVSEMQDDAREWRYMLRNTEARQAGFCLDLECAVRAGANPWTLIDAAGGRLRSLHLRNLSHGKSQDRLQDGDIDLAQIASLLRSMQYDGFLVVELARDSGVQSERSLPNSLTVSREYTHMVFGSRAGDPPVKWGPHVRFPR